MENSLFLCLQVSILCISIIAICKTMFLHEYTLTINIVIIRLNKSDKYLNQTVYVNIDTSEEVILDEGYKLNHYEWDFAKRTLLLFIKPHEYGNTTMDMRHRQLVLSHIITPIKIIEIYRRGDCND